MSDRRITVRDWYRMHQIEPPAWAASHVVWYMAESVQEFLVNPSFKPDAILICRDCGPIRHYLLFGDRIWRLDGPEPNIVVRDIYPDCGYAVFGTTEPELARIIKDELAESKCLGL